MLCRWQHAAWWRRCALLLALIVAAGVAVAADPSLDELRVERTDDGLLLHVQTRFELAESVQRALHKGIPMHFVAETALLRPRWYWYDEQIALAVRHMRIAWQPLTRRWRLNISSEPIPDDATPVGLIPLYFDSLENTLAAVQQITGWRVAEPWQLPDGSRRLLRFSFRLDESRLPRALRLAGSGPSDWRLSFHQDIELDEESVP